MRVRPDRRAFLAGAACFGSGLSAGLPAVPGRAGEVEWRPPLGIPMPPFGATESSPALPARWDSNRPGFYYVRDGGTNVENGFPRSPRGGLPPAPPPGAVVVIDQGTGVSGGGGVISGWTGVAAKPIWVVSSHPTGLAPLRYRELALRSVQYLILERLAITLRGESAGALAFMRAHHVAMRDCHVAGNPAGGGVGIGVAGEPASHIVLLRCAITDSGDVNAGFDQDRHGIVTGAASEIWVLDSEVARSSGDGMQIQGSTQLYVGRSRFHHNRQSGVWLKGGRDVIVSQCEAYGHRMHTPAGVEAGVGAGFGGQYDHEWDWWLFNRSYDNNNGFQVGSEMTGIPRSQHFWIGNLVYGITASDSRGAVPFSAAFHLWGGRNRYVISNSCWSCPQFVWIANPNTPDSLAHLESNIFWDRTGAIDIGADRSFVVANSRIRRNIFSRPPRFNWGIPQTGLLDLENGTTRKDNAIIDPRFVNPAAGDFHLRPGSPAIDSGLAAADVYEEFERRYRRSIRVDSDGLARPQGASFDKGAFEFPRRP